VVLGHVCRKRTYYIPLDDVRDVVIDLHTDLCPRTTKNFLKLCKAKYYNNCLFHNVQKDFMVQTGDPTGTGRGGQSVYGILYGDQAKYFEDEIVPQLKHKKKGTVSMANKGKDQNGSQFFITTSKSDVGHLDEKYTVFGEVEEGLDVLDKINEAFCDDNGRPLRNIRIHHTAVLDDPFSDPPTLKIPDRSPEPVRDQHDVERIADDEVLDDDSGRTAEEIEKSLKDKEAKSRAIVLEMIGDIPDADVAPPDNVLFVCKLNPVTEDDDLQLIFSRFGTIKSCEVIRDWKTGDSLQYAFIEFETSEMCEQAYHKMENVLIDDRRIHVDFSQSVAKLWGSYKRGDKDMKGNFNSSGQPNKSNLVLKSGRQPEKGSQHQFIFDKGDGHKKEVSTKNSRGRRRSRSKERRGESPKRSQKKEKRRSRSRSRDRQKKGGKR